MPGRTSYFHPDFVTSSSSKIAVSLCVMKFINVATTVGRCIDSSPSLFFARRF